jgi:membrane peptidoglycan carboxypeptidase
MPIRFHSNTEVEEDGVTEKTGNLQLGAAVVGGYILGRTKRGRTALRLAMWLGGDQGGPAPRFVGMARSGVNQVTGSDEAKQIAETIKGPLMEAAQRAAMTAVTARVAGITQRLDERTKALNEITGSVADTVSEPKQDEQPEEPEQPEAEQEHGQDEPEDEQESEPEPKPEQEPEPEAEQPKEEPQPEPEQPKEPEQAPRAPHTRPAPRMTRPRRG